MPPKKADALPGASRTRLPHTLQFFLVVILSFSASAGLYSVGSIFTKYELSTISRSVKETWEVLLFPAWRIVELAVGWYAHYDDLDMAALTIQMRLPFYYLIYTFYGVSFETTAICLSIDIVSSCLPFYLLRSRNAVHNSKAPAGSVASPSVINDFQVNFFTTTFAATIYSLIIYISLRSWLTVYIVTHFDGVRSLEKAHAIQLPALIATALPVGWAANTFLFSPSTGARPSLKEIRAKTFNPATASLGEHFKQNLWGWNVGTRVLIKRNVVLASMVGLATWLRVWKTIEGSEAWGSAGWAMLWASSSFVSGVLLRWVGSA